MLGNFSFGDYFKEESIIWAWEFLTHVMALDPRRLHPSVFKDDEEAFGIWKRLEVPNAPTRLGEDSNFWNMGPTGPCGPCSEIYFDRGPEHSCGKPSCAVGCDCDRYIEIWNLVFTQFDRQPDGSLKPLPRKNIDTGMGLERLALVASGLPSPFQTDLFWPILDKASSILGAQPGKGLTDIGLRVIADHVRASTMLLAEGVLPSNVERGYVLRRLIRRALRYGELLGHGEPFLYLLVPAVISIFDQAYPEMRRTSTQVAETLRLEEKKFLETLSMGEQELEAMLKKSGPTLPGDQVFKLYETFGFPLELTREICSQRGVAVDEEGFQNAAAIAAKIARASWKGSGEKTSHTAGLELAQTEFVGYEFLEAETIIVVFQPQGERGILVLEKTPFYPEGGGQVGDEGLIFASDRKTLLARVIDTQKQGSAILHAVCDAQASVLTPGLKVFVKVDAVRRDYIRPHHTGTHLLNEALRRILGAHVRQAGSYVGADKLRFDFTHPKALDAELIKKVETLIAEEIRKGEPVLTKIEPIEKAKEFGALSLLGEDYGSHPRMVLIGPDWQQPQKRFSLELCGGTHVSNTSEIASFRILKESSVAAGTRRIEALAGKAVNDYESLKNHEEQQSVFQLLSRQKDLLGEISTLGGHAEESPPSARSLSELHIKEKELKELITRLKFRKLASALEAESKTIDIAGLRLKAQRLDGADPKSLRELSDKAKKALGSGLVFLAAPNEGRLSFVLAATPDLLAKGLNTAKIAKAFASRLSGSAGGRADFAQGGIADSDWDHVLAELSSQIKASA
jgi:alanyl-tRNA synthetase